MELYLQFGYAMRPACLQLLENWSGGTVILSPRDLDPNTLPKVCKELQKAGADVLFDAQFYLPHADHKTLCKHSYWPNDYSSGEFFGNGSNKLVNDLATLNLELGSKHFILPGMHAETIDDTWLECHRMIAETAAGIDSVAALPKVATVALAAEALVDDEQIHELIEALDEWPVAGVYLVCEHSQGDYLVKDTNWLINLLDLAAGIRLQGKTVIGGYSNHQSLILATVSVNAIASGTWMNVRSFPPEKFVMAAEDEVKTKSIWYYCPQALSEYKITFLDVAQRQGVLGDMRADAAYGSSYADSIFKGPGRPSLLGLKERDSFLHYLQCLRTQTAQSRLSTFDATIDAHNRMLDSAETLLNTLHRQGVRGQNRDFKDILDVNRAAIAALQTTRGPMLKRNWGSLQSIQV